MYINTHSQTERYKRHRNWEENYHKKILIKVYHGGSIRNENDDLRKNSVKFHSLPSVLLIMIVMRGCSHKTEDVYIWTDIFQKEFALICISILGHVQITWESTIPPHPPPTPPFHHLIECSLAVSRWPISYMLN